MPKKKPLPQAAVRPSVRLASLASFAILAGAPGAAGAAGHFDVDDAGTLDPGRCQYEAWWTRVPAERTTFLHLGPACRVGPVELGVNLDRFAVGDRDGRVLGPQVKWTFLGTAPEAMLSAALSLSANVELPRRGRTGGQAVLPLTWRASDTLQLHANAGYDWAIGDGRRSARHGIAVEWAATPQLSLIAERNRAFDAWTTRVGLRVNLSPTLSVDLSSARTGTQGARIWVLGLNQEFGRP